MYHVVVMWDPNCQRWRAWWTADHSMAWLGDTPEEALQRAIANLHPMPPDIEYDLPATVVAVMPDGTIQDSDVLEQLRARPEGS